MNEERKKKNAIESNIARPEHKSSPLTLAVWVHLAVFALSVVIPLWVLFGFAAWSEVREERNQYQQQTMLVARNLASDLGRELSSFSGVLKALAASPAIEDRDLRRFHQQALQVVPPGGAIVMRDRTGQQVVNTLVPFGAPLPITAAPAVLAADECVFKTRAICASDLFIGTNVRQSYVLLDTPVFRDGDVVYALNVAIEAKHLASLLSDHRTPPGWVVSILDRQDRIVARSAEHDRFVGQLANEALRAHATEAEGSVRTLNVAGVPVWGAYVRMPVWEWRIAIGVPEAVLGAPLRKSMLYLSGVGLLAIGLSVAGALLYGRHLARAIGELSRLAREVGGPSALPPVSTSIREVDRVGAALVEASTKLRASVAQRDRAQAELQHLNEELEARVEAEVAARQEAQAKAAHAQRIQALGQLASGIAHDFNNVLQATKGCAATIEKRATDPDAVRRFAQLIITASARGASVTRRLLAFAQQGNLKAEFVYLPELFAGLQEILSHTLGAHIAVHVALPSQLPPLFADKGQLETVLVNLATNARDAMRDGGSLTFSASAEEVTGKAAAPAGIRPGRYLRLTVADTGTGMDAATLTRASEPFFTTKARGAGTGLGLAMARGIAEQSGGALVIESRPGRGTTVYLWLPAREQQATVEVPAATTTPGKGLPAARQRVLLVEDEDIVREVVAAQLADEGYEVLAAANAEEALTILDRPGKPDALVTDFDMPGINGIELIRIVRSRGLSIPAVLLTGNAEDGTPLALEGAMAQNFSMLRKPVLGADLADRLTALTTAG